MTGVLSKSHKDFYYLFIFRYGDPASPTYLRLTDFSTDVSNGLAGGVFTSSTTIAVKGLHNTGTMSVKPITIRMPRGTFSDALSGMEPHSPVYVTIWEVAAQLESPSPQQIVVYKGRLTQGVRNEEGKSDLIRLEFKSLKDQMKIPLGLQTIPQCIYRFGDLDCKVDAVAVEDSGTLASIDGKKVTITGLGAQTGKYWHRGFVRYDGLQIMIRDWDNDVSATLFYLVQEPPASWTGQTVDVRPGCDKSPETCDTRWSNIANFGGIGYATPNRNPAFHSS